MARNCASLKFVASLKSWVKECSLCKQLLEVNKENFPSTNLYKGTKYSSTKCRPCIKLAARKRNQDRRYQVLVKYSEDPPKCKCCKESYIEFLAIDHINGGGAKHRKEMGETGSGTNLANWLIKHNFPEGFQVLCHNCNMAKGFYGKCPHETTN